MTSILMVNPSANMRLTAMEMKMYGANVEFVYSSDVPLINADRVFYFLSGVNICFTTEIQGEMEREDRVFLFKKNIFSRFKMMGFKKNMEISYPELSSGTFTDLLLFKRSVLRNYEDKTEHDLTVQYSSYSDILRHNRESMIITSHIVGQGNENIAYWETDFDLVSTFNNDYFVFFGDNRRVEAYILNNQLITIGKGDGNKHLYTLSSLLPMVTKFYFKKVDEKLLLRNFNPWFYPLSGNLGFLINDYSFGSLSVSMPSAWYDRFANYIHNYITNKKLKKY